MSRGFTSAHYFKPRIAVVDLLMRHSKQAPAAVGALLISLLNEFQQPTSKANKQTAGRTKN
jgi:hypothetical protein